MKYSAFFTNPFFACFVALNCTAGGLIKSERREGVKRLKKYVEQGKTGPYSKRLI